jgi:hypothetical protein
MIFAENDYMVQTLAADETVLAQFFERRQLAYLLQTSFPGETSALLMRSKMNDFPLSIGASRRIEH